MGLPVVGGPWPPAAPVVDPPLPRWVIHEDIILIVIIVLSGRFFVPEFWSLASKRAHIEARSKCTIQYRPAELKADDEGVDKIDVPFE